METNIDLEALEPPIKKTRIDEKQTNTQEITDTSPELQKKSTTQDQYSTDLIANIKQEADFSKDVTEYENYLPEEYNQVSQEELDKLKEFKVLDEVNCNDDDSEERDSDDSSEEDIGEEEIEKMLDENLSENFKAAPKPKQKTYVTRQKIVLEEKGVNQFEVLPLDWIVVRHQSGIPIYMHRPTRVCTLSKPYSLGKGNIKRHDIPISAIPCLNYRKALEEEAKQNEIDRRIAEQIKIISGQGQGDTNSSQNKSAINKICPFVNGQVNNNINKIDNKLTEIDTTENINETRDNTKECSNEIQTNEKQICDTNEHSLGNENDNNQSISEMTNNVDGNENKQSNDMQSLIDQNELDISIAAKPVVLPGGKVMAPPRVENVKTSWKCQHLSCEQVNDYCKKLFKFKTVNIMHFQRWADRRQYTKARKALQYPTLPEGTKLITVPPDAAGENGVTGKARSRVMNMNGRSYLSVFHEYVRRALHAQPEYKFKQLENASCPYEATVYIGDMQYGVGRGSSKRVAKSNAAKASIQILIPEMREEQTPKVPTDGDIDLQFFDSIGIEDPRITEFCAVTCEPSPHAILRTCLLRNFGAGEEYIQTEMKKLQYQKVELKMKVGKHTATVVCKNKKSARQRASQAILQMLHPHVKSWGSLLRLYGSRSVKSCKEKKLEEQQITLLQDKAKHNEPNYAVLEKLRAEMRSLRERDKIAPIGTLLMTEALPDGSAANLNNVAI